MKVAKIEGQGAERRPVREADLTVVSPAAAGERARHLYLEARKASLEHLDLLHASIESTRLLAEAVVEGGADIYGPGVVDLARRINEDLHWRGVSLEALIERQRAAVVVH